MKQLLENLSRPAVVLPILGIVLIVNGLLFYRYQTQVLNEDVASNKDVASNTYVASSEDREATSAAEISPEIVRARYVENVGDVQNAAVQSFARINDKIRRYDTLTLDDTQAIEAEYLALADYSAQAEDLGIPEEYEAQHELFSGAIRDLYAAAEIARRVTTAPTSATPTDFKEYDDRVAEAASSLEQSNEVLGQDYSTTEGFQKVGTLAFNYRAVLA
jgi:hypothetical protein